MYQTLNILFSVLILKSMWVYNVLGTCACMVSNNVVDITFPRIIVQTFKIVLRGDIHFEVRKWAHGKPTIFLQNSMIIVYNNVSTHGKLNSFLVLRIHCEQLSFHISMGSMPLPRKFHEEHNDTYCDLGAPLFLMNLPLRVNHKPRNGLSRS